MSQSKFVTKKQINTVRGYCWGPSSSKGPKNVIDYMFSVWHGLLHEASASELRSFLVTRVKM
jgi:hypothetical protein